MKNILEVINKYNSFVLAGHTSPDGDAIGSCCALALALNDMGKQARVILEPFAQKYHIIPGREFFVTPNQAEALQPEVFIALDCAAAKRLCETARKVFERTEVTICIDHHDTNKGFAMHNYIDSSASSTAEMVFNIVYEISELTQDIATAIYAGMISDTGGFKYNATAKSTMLKASRLMEIIPFTNIYNELMHKHRFSAGKALGLALEKSERTKNKKIVFTYMTNEMLESVKASHADLDGIVEYLMTTRNALVAIFVYEKKGEQGKAKVSLRSHGPDVGRVASALGGGGHVLAAGATVDGTVDEILRLALKLVKKEVEKFS
ncbi:MAG: bifunctional oligoribonuclease/PAP phosphatase NrnA [Defluviitaleaceae bacterium]|nr:bifunctional oligoribonuclease/PAP phosphatase NrnA [Defluviitaleaceae bacterium]